MRTVFFRLPPTFLHYLSRRNDKIYRHNRQTRKAVGKTENILTIYIDILFITNGVINSALLLMCYRFLGVKPKALSFSMGVLISTAYGLTVCLPGMSFFTSTFFKTVSACLISLTAFGGHIKRGGGRVKGLLRWGKCTCIFAFVSFAYAAVVTTFQYAPFAKDSIYINNGEIYYNIPVPYLLTAILILLSAQSLLLKTRTKKVLTGQNVTAILRVGGIKQPLTLLADSGNLATDPLSGTPVVFVSRTALTFLPKESVKANNVTDLFEILSSVEELRHRLSLIPCKTATSGGIMVAFRPDRLEIEGQNIKVLTAILPKDALLSEGFDGIINPNLITPTQQQKGERKCSHQLP